MALKSIGFHHAVGVTLDLVFLRVSVDYGARFDIARNAHFRSNKRA
jgi:4-hydroxy-L-threonine phosphate dehydrogenase PdxA